MKPPVKIPCDDAPANILPLEIKSRDEAEAAMAQVVALIGQINYCILRKNKIQVLAQRRDAKIQDLTARKSVHEKRLEAWSKTNRTEFGEAKSLELRHGFLRFRMGREAVLLVDGTNDKEVIKLMGWTGKLIAGLRELIKPRKFAECVRVKLELDRQQLLKDFKAEKLDESELKAVGLEVKAEEHFEIEPKLDGLAS